MVCMFNDFIFQQKPSADGRFGDHIPDVTAAPLESVVYQLKMCSSYLFPRSNQFISLDSLHGIFHGKKDISSDAIALFKTHPRFEIYHFISLGVILRWERKKV
ncbi:hypothetical protein TNCT_131541 [Trichonephila clavata]|uniref:Uncharacterized protein n=1 Tax=Trichonephila clavata TaxID=2740835 RepID=A0A8X6L721_TRICU|nr:hypothetical protein TNCT_131541 [Trichonephila clavata]